MKLAWPGLSVVVLLAACGVPATPEHDSSAPRAAGAHPIAVTDALGRRVTLPSLPRRIVITGKAMVMVADAAYTFPSAPARIVALGKPLQGRDNFIALIDPAWAGKAVIEQQASAEEIAALRPDLVILKSALAETLGATVATLEIPVVYVDFETPEQYPRDLAILGAVFGDPTRAGQVWAFFESRVSAIQAALGGVESRPTVLVLYYRDRDGNVAFNVPPQSWMQTRLVAMAGGVPVWVGANPGRGWAQVSLEQVAAWDADDIFVTSYARNASEVVAGLKRDPQWRSLRAVRTGHLHAFPGDFYSWDQPDTRWILGLTWLAGRLHPRCFPNLDMVREAREFYQALYGLDERFFERRIRPAMSGDLR